MLPDRDSVAPLQSVSVGTKTSHSERFVNLGVTHDFVLAINPQPPGIVLPSSTALERKEKLVDPVNRGSENSRVATERTTFIQYDITVDDLVSSIPNAARVCCIEVHR